MDNRVYIPEMSEEQIASLAKKIKPTYRSGDVLRFIQPVDLYKTAFLWSPKPTKKVTNVEKLQDITTYHSYGYYAFFKPNIAEVLRQIPAEIVDKVVAFEIIDSPKNADDLNREYEALNAGYHVATTRLYGKISMKPSDKKAKTFQDQTPQEQQLHIAEYVASIVSTMNIVFETTVDMTKFMDWIAGFIEMDKEQTGYWMHQEPLYLAADYLCKVATPYEQTYLKFRKTLYPVAVKQHG